MIIPSEWPITPPALRALVAQQESALLEFKREWYDTARKEGKGEQVRDVLSLANSLARGDIGLIIIGREDDKEGGTLVGIRTDIREEHVLQVINHYSARVPSVRFAMHRLDNVTLGVIRIEGTGGGPYYLAQPLGSASHEFAYVRKGTITTKLTPAELEDMVRSRATAVETHPIACGFTQLPYSSRYLEPVFRIRNSSLDPIAGITVILDAHLISQPGAVARWVPVPDGTLSPGETEDLRLRRDMFFFTRDDQHFDLASSRSDYRWVDLRATVNYHDHHGFVRSIEHHARLDWRT